MRLRLLTDSSLTGDALYMAISTAGLSSSSEAIFIVREAIRSPTIFRAVYGGFLRDYLGGRPFKDIDLRLVDGATMKDGLSIVQVSLPLLALPR